MGVVVMGATNAFIARAFGCSRVAVTSLMQRYRHLDRPRTDRPRVTTPHEDRNLHTLYFRNRDAISDECFKS